MTEQDRQFIMSFNEYYPFERLIIKKPESINYLFDDALLTEIFIPKTEFSNPDVKINEDEIYVKLVCKGIEFRLSFFDFNETVRETIINIVISSFGDFAWEQLQVEFNDKSDLIESLTEQVNLIKKKYGNCNIKDGFCITSTIEILNKLC